MTERTKRPPRPGGADAGSLNRQAKTTAKAGVEGGSRVAVSPRRYTKRQKVTAVIAAELSSQSQASETQAIPLATLNTWFNQPWAIELRKKTREDLGEESRVLAHRVLQEIERKLPDFGPRDLPILYGILVDKGQLLGGQATTRTETADITEPHFSDDERAALAAAIDRELKARVTA